MPEPLSPFLDAPQHGPRPLPLFLHMLRSETEGQPDRRAAALSGLKAYQAAKRDRAHRLAPKRYKQGRAVLRDYAPGHSGRPIVFVPSLINPPRILDLARSNSMLRWLAAQGFRPFLLDWGDPGPDARDMDLTHHVERLLVPLLRRFRDPPVLAGYCLGGTLAMGAASMTEVAGLGLIAAPWRFAGFGAARRDIAELWSLAKPACETMGLVPVEVLQTGFWKLDPGRTVGKYERFARLDPGSNAARSFIALEDWANQGAPLPYAAARQLFEDFVAADAPGKGKWLVGGKPVDPAALACPTVEFVSLNDRIVPAASSASLPGRTDLGTGHVGMVVGSRAREQLWQPIAHWLSGIEGTKGAFESSQEQHFP